MTEMNNGLRFLKERERWKRSETIFWLFFLAAPFAFPEDRLFFAQIAILAIYCLSLDLILGYAGILSLGQAAFFGVGAYAAGLLSVHFSQDPIIALLVGGAAAGVVGLISAPLLLGGKDLTRLLITLAVAAILFELANKLSFITGGIDGLQGVSFTPIFGKFEFDLAGNVAYWYSASVLVVLFLLARWLMNSPLGLSLVGVRLNAFRMPALGAPVNRRLTQIYTIGAVYAGIAGSLLTQTTQFVSLDSLSFHRSAELMLMLVLGGTGSLYGAILGAIIFSVAHHMLSELNPQYWQFWMGVLLVAIVLFAKDGFMGGLRFLEKRLLKIWRHQ